jgi:hypothetical protein
LKPIDEVRMGMLIIEALAKQQQEDDIIKGRELLFGDTDKKQDD